MEFTKKDEQIASRIALGRLPKIGSSVHSNATLEQNKQVRDAGGAPTDVLDWGFCGLSIPPAHMRVLMLRYPDMNAPDPVTRYKAFWDFFQSLESAPYRIRPRDGKKGVTNKGIIIK